jgi:hypothetical protein
MRTGRISSGGACSERWHPAESAQAASAIARVALPSLDRFMAQRSMSSLALFT